MKPLSGFSKGAMDTKLHAWMPKGDDTEEHNDQLVLGLFFTKEY